MQEPIFNCGNLTRTVAHPKTWERTPVVGASEDVTIGGYNVKDVTYRKYRYTLTWDAMTNEDVEKLIEIYNEHLDSQEEVNFTYLKWTTTTAGVNCKMEMSPQVFRAGSGETLYLSELTITLTETSPR